MTACRKNSPKDPVSCYKEHKNGFLTMKGSAIGDYK